MTLTYNPSLAEVKVDLHDKNEVKSQTAQTGELGKAHIPTNWQTNGTKSIISPLRGQ